MAKKSNFNRNKRSFTDLFTGNASANTQSELRSTEAQVEDSEMLDAAAVELQDDAREIELKADIDSAEYEYVLGTAHDEAKQDDLGYGEAEEVLVTYREPMVDMQTTTISTDTIFAGEINSNGHIEIYGNLNGNVNAKGNVRIYGQVVGDIKGNNIELVSCKVRGNINADATVQINHESVIAGNVSAADMILDGKLKGDVMLERTTLFMENAVLYGNVYAGTISIKNGAKLYGEIQIENGNDDEAFADI
jgi:cytoskeletal protein CcmA (bactofilin family)